MKKLILSGLAGLLAIAMIGTPLALHAADTTNAPAKKAARKVGNDPIPFHGNVKAIDNNAKTLSVGKEDFQITSETKITNLGKPATLADGAEGVRVTGAYKKDADGKLTATTVRFGPKTPVVSSNTKTNKP
jgi:hypothetical protein